MTSVHGKIEETIKSCIALFHIVDPIKLFSSFTNVLVRCYVFGSPFFLNIRLET
jgi:hypothetical protein